MPQSGPTPVDHFAFQIWERSLLPLLEGSKGLLAWLLPIFSTPSVWEQLGMTQDVFLKHLEVMLKQGKDFRASLTKRLSEEPLQRSATQEARVRYFYSEKYPTTSQVYVNISSVDSGKGIVPTGGDGRVLQVSATNSNRWGFTPIALRSTHGDLVKDTTFISWLRKEFYKDIHREEVKDTVHALMNEEFGKEALRNQNIVLSLSDLGINPLRSLRDIRVESILDLNTLALRDSVTKIKPDLAREEIDVQAYNFASYLHNEQQDVGRAIPFSELALARRQPLTGAVTGTLVAYSAALLQDGDYPQAFTVLKSSLDELIADIRWRPDALNNLGVAYEGLGSAKVARGAYGLAAGFGSKEAQGNLRRVSNE